MHSKQSVTKSARNTARRILGEPLENRLLFAAGTPTVNTVTPANGDTAIALDATVQATVNLPNGGIDPNTVTSSAVYLYQTAYPNNNSKYVPANVKTTGGGDAILLSPLSDLLPSTSYTFVVNAGLKDINGDAFAPFSESFTTGNSIPVVSQNYAFTPTALSTTQGVAFTDVQIGPDGLFYGSTEDGRIIRYAINSDGTLGTPQIITSLQTANGGNRLISGFAFDPSFIADPTQPKLWVSNTYYALSGATNAPNFTGKLTVMSGTNLQNVTDAVTNLPRSVSDHVNDQPVFQPGTQNLFFCQAGQNAYGAPDTTWGNRAETLLSGAILELNTAALNLGGSPLNALTTDVGGTYNPYANGAPLTIYATGVRNAFDLMFDDKGQLWAPANGSSSGGNSPGNGSTVPALTNIQQVESDTLIKVSHGAYYGHPNPTRGQYVLDQGNPSSGGIPGLAFTAYPSGTAPDANYKLPNYIFGLHSSPDGIIEYHGNAFGGKLEGKFLVAEYSAPNDIVVLSRDSANNIVGGLASGSTSPAPDRAVSGLTHLNGPVSLVENPSTGYLYVSELGGNKITLLKPSSIKPQISSSAARVAFNTIAAGNPGAAPSRTETVTITNNGADQLNFNSISIINDPSSTAAASNFSIINAGTLPTTLASVGSSCTIQLQYTASVVGLQNAILQLKTNDPVTPTLNIYLHGIGTAGQFGSNEPSLVQILRAHGIPTIVGAGPNDVNINTVAYPENPDPSSEEVSLQKLVAATPGPVTITPIASFSASAQPVSTIGYYTPGNAATATALFSINQADAQTVDPTPQGSTSFNPGSNIFGLFADFPGVTTPNGAADYHYSEDALNTLDPTRPRKIRFFPYRTSAGAIVPNTYVFAVEDYNDPTYNSFTNFVGIISNVSGVPPVPANVSASTAGNTGVVLSWTASAGATNYIVQRQDPGTSGFVTIASDVTATTFTDANVTAGATYHYVVQAQNAVGVSALSSVVSATQPLIPPSAPGNLQISSATASGVVLTWNAAAGADTYAVLRKAPSDSGFSTIATGLTAATYTDANVVGGQSYQYEVTAQNSAGASPASAPITAAVSNSVVTSVTIGKGAARAVQFATSAGAVVILRLTGGGTATVDFVGTTLAQSATRTGIVISGTNVAISGISTTGSVSRSVLSVLTRGGNRTVNLANISIDGSLNALNAPGATLSGTLAIAGSVNRIVLGSAVAATISVGGFIGTLQAPLVSNLAVTANGAIRNINATTWTSTRRITAASIGSINVRGDAQIYATAAAVHAVHVRGNLHDSIFNLTGPGIVDLAMLAAGSISGTAIDSAGSMGSISAGALVNSQIYAGVGATGLTAFPPVTSSFPTAASIANVNIRKGHGGAVSVVNASIAALKLNSVSLGLVQFSNGGVPFGVEAGSVNSFTAVNPATGKNFTFKRLTSADVVAADLASKGISTQDFVIQIL